MWFWASLALWSSTPSWCCLPSAIFKTTSKSLSLKSFKLCQTKIWPCSHGHILIAREVCFCLFGFLKSSSTTRPYRGRAPRQSVWQFYVLPHMRQSCETMGFVSAGHTILTPTQPEGGGWPLRESNPGPPNQKSRALPTELPHFPVKFTDSVKFNCLTNDR